MEEKFQALRAQTHGNLTFVLWGEWETWRSGFSQASDEDGEQYARHCRILVRTAGRVCDEALWIRGEELNSQPAYDGWHFDDAAKTFLQQRLQDMSVAIDANRAEVDGESEKKARKLVEEAPKSLRQELAAGRFGNSP